VTIQNFLVKWFFDSSIFRTPSVHPRVRNAVHILVTNPGNRLWTCKRERNNRCGLGRKNNHFFCRDECDYCWL